MIEWPTHLITELADRRAIIFLGSGISASSTGNGGVKPPKWDDFLKSLSSKLGQTDQEVVNQLIDTKDFLNAAEIILSDAPPGDIEQAVESTLVAPRFQPSEMHMAIHAIERKLL